MFYLPKFPESASVAFRCVAYLKPVLQVEAPGQLNKTLSCANVWGYVSLHCLCSVLGVVSFPKLSNCYCPVRSRSMSPFGHRRHQESSPVCTALTVFCKVMEESWGQGLPVTLTVLERNPGGRACPWLQKVCLLVPDYICLCLTMLARQREGTKNGTVQCLHS